MDAGCPRKDPSLFISLSLFFSLSLFGYVTSKESLDAAAAHGHARAAGVWRLRGVRNWCKSHGRPSVSAVALLRLERKEAGVDGALVASGKKDLNGANAALSIGF